MTTTSDYKAVVTTEICIPLAQIPEEDILRIIGKNGRNLKIVENNSNTRCAWDKKNLNIYIHGEPKDAKQAYTVLMAQMTKFAGTNGTTAPDAMVNILGKEFVDGVCFCKLADATPEGSDGDDSQDESDLAKSKKASPDVFVVHPISMTDNEKQKGRIMASELWRNAQFVTWDFKGNVIQDASMVLRRQLQRMPQRVGKYLKLEMAIGKVIFLENDKKHFPLQGAKFAIGEFRHLRFNKEITSKFRKEWEESWIAQLRGILPTLGYDKDGNTTKSVNIYHTAQREDGKCYDVIWSTDILEGKRLGDSKPGTLEFIKARVRGDNPFSATVYGPATAFDFRFSIITNTRESAAHNQEIEDRVRKAYRYSTKRGLLVNHSYENCNGHTPLVSPTARMICETTWLRGDIKVIINEIQDGLDSTFEVKLQSNLLKKYTREELGEVPLTDTVEAMKDFLEAAEEINGELNLLTAGLPPKRSPGLTKMEGVDIDNLYITPPSAIQPIYKTLSASVHSAYGAQKVDRASNPTIQPPHLPNFMPKAASAGISAGGNGGSTSRLFLSADKSRTNIPEKGFMSIPRGSLKKTYSETNPKDGLMDNALPESATFDVGTETFWEGCVADRFGVGIPVLTPTRKTLQGTLPIAEGILLKNDRLKVKRAKLTPVVTTAYLSSDSSVTAKGSSHGESRRKQVPTAASTSDSLPPHLRPVVRAANSSANTTIALNSHHSSSNPSHIGRLSPSIDFSDCCFDLLGSTTDDDTGPSTGVLMPNKVVATKSRRMKIDFFGSVGSPKEGEAGDLMSWNSDKDTLAYFHEGDSLDMEVGEDVSLLLD